MATFWVEWADSKVLIGTVEAESLSTAEVRAGRIFSLAYTDFTVRPMPAEKTNNKAGGA